MEIIFKTFFFFFFKKEKQVSSYIFIFSDIELVSICKYGNNLYQLT